MRALLVLAAVSAAACAPTLSIVAYEPGRIEPRGARTLVLVDGEGHVDGRKVAARILADEAQGGIVSSWWRVDERDARMVLHKAHAEVTGGSLRGDELWARLDVVQWDVDNIIVQEENEDGEIEDVPAMQAEVLLQMTVADAEGHVLLREEQYKGTVLVTEGALGPADPLAEAARIAASSFLDAMSPKKKSEGVRLDDSDPGMKKLVNVVISGDMALREAERRTKRYLKKNPNNAIATYDLAVFLDAQGKHEQALAKYDEAMKINTRPYYVQSREGCVRRVAARKAMFEKRGELRAPPAPKEEPPKGEAPPPPS